MGKNYEDIGLNSRLRKTDSLATKVSEQKTAMEQDAQFERTPYGNPTQIHKGLFQVTGGGTFIIKDTTGGTTAFIVDPNTGSVTYIADIGQTGDLDITGDLTVNGTSITGAYTKGEVGYVVAAPDRTWTNSSSYADVSASKFKLDGDNFALTNVYFEVLGCVELADRTAYFQLYNTTDGSAVANSEITTTNVGTAYEWLNAEVIRSGTLAIPSGIKEYKMQAKQVAGGTESGDNAQLLKAQMIFINT